MSDSKPEAEASPAPAPSSGGALDLMVNMSAKMGRLRAWAAVHWTRSVIVATLILVLIAATVAGWAYLASLAFRGPVISLDSALEALDQGKYEEARMMVGTMLQSGNLPRNEYGGPLLVLGAIKTHDAELQTTTERRRVEYLVASRYLNEARTYGFPPKRETEGMFLLGHSLLESNQFDDGIDVLEELLANTGPAIQTMAWKAHLALAQSCASMPRPNLRKALEHNEALLAKPDLSPSERDDALLLKATCLSGMNRFDEARQTLSSVTSDNSRRSEILLTGAQITFDELDAALDKTSASGRSEVLTAANSKLDEAMQQLQQAKSLDTQASAITRKANYLTGRGLEYLDKRDDALRQFARVRQLYGDTLEGVASALAEADLLLRKGETQGALLGYRRVLESFTNTASYRSTVLPLDRVRARVLTALASFVEKRNFDEALTLLMYFPPLFSRTEQLEFRGELLQQWGHQLLGDSTGEDTQPDPSRTGGLRQLRAAGLAFEQLAELRFATKSYTNDLWRSAEAYFRGHSFSRTISVLGKYLKNEPELRNADALMRLGQAHLALGQVSESVTALEECIEFHPVDSSTYQARIDCAKAYWYLGNMSKAEELLRENIAGSTLKPSSREWKDSLFELGMLLHETGEHEQAISILEEAVERYPHDPQSLVAQYEIGESYRKWAEGLLERAKEVRTASEREKNQQFINQRLTKALEQFDAVQRNITLKTHDIHSDPLMGTMLRNCYMLEGTVLFDSGQYEEAIKAYSNVSSLYPNEPFVLETFVQIANCWRRLQRPDKARGAIQQAQTQLERLPTDADFLTATSFNRDEWRALLATMGAW